MPLWYVRGAFSRCGEVCHARRVAGSSAVWSARSVRDAEAGGSNPPFPTGEIAGQREYGVLRI